MKGDVLPWLEQAVLDWQSGTFRPASHYILLFEGAAAEIRRFREAERNLSARYVKLREMLRPWGALDTAPGGADRFEKTEAALRKLIDLAKAGPVDASGEPAVCKRCLGSRLDTYVNPKSPTGFTERPCPACAAAAAPSSLAQPIHTIVDIQCGQRNYHATLPAEDYKRVVQAILP